MKSKESFLNEVYVRSEGNFNPQYVLNIYDSYDSDRDNEFHECAIAKGFVNYPYLIVMPVADRNLNEIVTNGELIDETDLHFVRSVIIDITRCLNHLHAKDFIHGDIKPKNIMRSEASYKLIDLDGASRIGEFGGIKISSADLAMRRNV
jgi:serine/threonine protein kinase